MASSGVPRMTQPGGGAQTPRARPKPTFMDQWTAREKLFLVTVVTSSGGDQNWVSVARTMKAVLADQGRPLDWYSQKNCALQYDQMLEGHEREAPSTTSRRAKRTSESSATAVSGSAATTADAAQLIGQRLKDERTQELSALIEATTGSLATLRADIDELEDEDISEDRLDELERLMALEEAEDEAAAAAATQRMQEREERKLAFTAALKSGLAPKPLTGAASASAQAAKERRLSEAQEAAAAAAAAVSPAVTPAKTAPSPEVAAEPQTSPLLSLLLQTASTPAAAPGTPSSPATPQTPGSPLKSGNAQQQQQPMSEGLQSMFEKLEGAETRGHPLPVAAPDSGDSSTLSKLLALPLADKGRLPDVAELAENLPAESDPVGDGPSPAPVPPPVPPPAAQTEVAEAPAAGPSVAVKREEESEDVEVDVERDTSKEEIPAESDVQEDRAVDPPSDTPRPEEPEEAMDKKRLPPPTVATVATPPLRSTKRTTSERSEDSNEPDELGGSSTRGRRSSKRTSAQSHTEEDEEGPTGCGSSFFPENRRLSRVRGALSGSSLDDTASNRGRRGSGATSRSSSPTESEDTAKDDSESEPTTSGGRSTRARRRSGIRPGLEESAPNSPASSTAANTDSMEAPSAPPSTPSSGPPSTSGGSLVVSTPTTPAPPLLLSGGPPSKPFKHQGVLILNNIQTHQFALTFENTAAGKNVPDYAHIVLRPMDLKTIKSNLETGAVSNIHDMFRDLNLMLLNAIMFSPSGSQTYKDAMVFYRFAREQMQEFLGAHLLATATASVSPNSRTPQMNAAAKMKTKGRRDDRKRAAEDTPPSHSSGTKKRKR